MVKFTGNKLRGKRKQRANNGFIQEGLNANQLQMLDNSFGNKRQKADLNQKPIFMTQNVCKNKSDLEQQGFPA